MNVLDIDLDFFLDPRPIDCFGNDRLSPFEYHAWTPQCVEDYLTQQCKLLKSCPLRGAAVTCHHELFDQWKKLVDSDELQVPFHLVHLDSHADMGMGMGDTSCNYIMGELLHRDLHDRCNPKRGSGGGLFETNFVSFALACRWISSITYVHHPRLFQDNCGLHDIPNCLFRDNDPRCGVLQLKKYPTSCLKSYERLEDLVPIALEPEVPIEFIDRTSYFARSDFSFLFVAQSPKYTPVTCDAALQKIQEFICP